jgi:hypothetical protein
MRVSYLKGVAVPEVRLWWPLNPSFRFFPFFFHRLIIVVVALLLAGMAASRLRVS